MNLPWQDPDDLAFMLRDCDVWAVVGLSGDPSRTAYAVSAAMHSRGKRIVPVHPGAPTLFVGPTCFEEDVLGEWVIDPPPIGTPVVVRGVSGYAVAWNTGFGGIPPAEVVIGDANRLLE